MTQPEYSISHFFHPAPESGVVLEGWPPHLTVIPPFRLTGATNETTILEIIAHEGKAIGPIEFNTTGSIDAGALPLVPGKKHTFGPPENPLERTEAVKINDPSGKLLLLHKHLLKSLVAIDCDFLDLRPEWSGDSYNPHVTLKGGLEISWPFFIPTLSLASKGEDGKRVVATVDMYNQTVL